MKLNILVSCFCSSASNLPNADNCVPSNLLKSRVSSKTFTSTKFVSGKSKTFTYSVLSSFNTE